MDENIKNRQATVKGRGRPTKAEVESRPEPIPADPVPLPVGRVCPCCGRAMVPKVLRGTPDLKYCSCTLCGGRFKMFIDAGRWLAQKMY